MAAHALTAPSPLDLSVTFQDKRILFIGATGFVGKVALSMLLRRYPGVGKVFVLVRPGAGSSAEDRFFRKVAASPVFDPLREVWGAGFEAFLREKVVPVAGDAGRPLVNFTESDLLRMTPLDAIVNCAGLVTFDPTLESALRINTYGVSNTLEVARRTRAALVHISTCFVAGNRDGEIWEDEEVLGYFPRKEELYDEDFSVHAEIADCERLIEQIRNRADDRMHVSLFRERGAERLRTEGRDPDEEKNLKVAVQRERKIFMAEQLQKLGMERAKHWGWTNTYTYTKSLGEKLCVEADRMEGEQRVRCCIVRPAIVESALRYPMNGWNEGFTTTAPLVMLALMGHTQYPVGEHVVLDLIPVDMVAAGIIAATGATIAGENHLVYQLASGDLNPLNITRGLGLLGLYKRRYYQQREANGTLPKWLNKIKSRMEPVRVSPEQWRRTSAPMIRTVANGILKKLDDWTPRWGAPRVAAMAERAKEKLSEVSQLMGKTADAFEIFMPFIHDRHYVFRCDQTRALFARLTDADRLAIPWDPERMDWRSYWLDTHLPGLEKWVMPSLEEEFQAKPRPVYTYKDLLELFEATTKHHRQRTAMRMMPPAVGDGESDGEPVRYSYGDLQELAQRAALALRDKGVAQGDKVMLLAENRPEWGITYFGILKAGAAVVPVDANATADEVLNILRSAKARVAVISDRQAERLDSVGLPMSALPSPRVRFEDLFDVEVRRSTAALVPLPKVRGDDLASLIFTSGTTGRPKGVMLSHRNFASLLSKLGAIFDIDKHDALLSVLPLHHTLEFTAGMLMPLMRGAQITYLDEVSAEGLSAAFKDAPVTGMVGVPALWQLLLRRVKRPLQDRGPLIERSFDFLVQWARKLRDGLPSTFSWLNVGKLLFLPVHARFGGRLRLLISGGSALPPELAKAFWGLGFRLYEGYGLTESSPVLTVTRPGRPLAIGSVGEALPGIDVKLFEPDASGVGEVIASGANVMLGYYEDPEATAATLRDGYLHTGDLGRFDEERRLYIVGRKKEVIIGLNGENVYPDELEEVYRDSPYVKELSIVGLPVEGEKAGEVVACLVVPEYDPPGESLARDTVRERLREHFQKVSTKLALPKRVKVLHLWEGELPKTATRKVRRKQVVEELRKLERAARQGAAFRDGDGKRAEGGTWLLDLLAQVSGKPRDRVSLEASMQELGIDSLTYAELGVALEAAGVQLPEQVDITGIGTVAELWRLVERHRGKAAPAKPKAAKAKKRDRDEDDDRVQIPEPLRRLGDSGLTLMQRMLYERVLDTRVTGKAYLPKASRFIVAANLPFELLDPPGLGPTLASVAARLTAGVPAGARTR